MDYGRLEGPSTAAVAVADTAVVAVVADDAAVAVVVGPSLVANGTDDDRIYAKNPTSCATRSRSRK